MHPINPPKYLPWSLEILSLITALLVLLAIVLLLSIRQEKPLPDWPSVLQVNSLVAIFSAAFKVALLYPIAEGISELKWIWYATPQPTSDFDRFDAASRGPFGSMKLLITHPRNLLTSFGAVITIFAIAIDPFTQQVVQFYSCTVPSHSSTATIPRTNNYSSFLETGDGTPLGVRAYVDSEMLGAICHGLLRPPTNSTATLSPYCSSGNCTLNT